MLPETIWLDANNKKVNIDAYQVRHQPDINGTRHPRGLTIEQLNALGYHETTIYEKPDDFSDALYLRTEMADAPYVVYTPRPAEQVAAARWEAIKAIRDAKTNGPDGCKVEVETGVFKWFHTDAYSKMQQLGLETTAVLMLVNAAAAGTPLDMNTPISATPWKTMDGSFVTLTVDLVLKVATAQKQRDMLLFGIAETKKNDATSINEGWPQTFVEYQAEQVV